MFFVERSLEDLLKNVSKGLTARVQLRKMTADEQQMLANHQLQELKQLKTKCDQVISVIFVEVKTTHVCVILRKTLKLKQ